MFPRSDLEGYRETTAEEGGLGDIRQRHVR
jgi:hypothetical protein